MKGTAYRGQARLDLPRVRREHNPWLVTELQDISEWLQHVEEGPFADAVGVLAEYEPWLTESETREFVLLIQSLRAAKRASQKTE